MKSNERVVVWRTLVSLLDSFLAPGQGTKPCFAGVGLTPATQGIVKGRRAESFSKFSD